MGQFSTEKKLELVRMIRTAEDQNKELLRRREALLYGNNNNLIQESNFTLSDKKQPENSEFTISGFKIRFTLAALLVGTVFLLEFLNMENYKEPLNTLYTEIAKEGNLFDFVEDLTYTLKDD